MIPYRFFAVCILAPCTIWSQQITKQPHFVLATGEAIVSAKPDRAQISIGVITQAATAQGAAAQNATETGQVLDGMKQIIGGSGEMNTSGYSISPQYQYSNGKSPKITAYQVSNTVLVTVNDLSLVGKIIDAATKSGANNVNTISFTLRNDQAVRAQALAEAAAKARANAVAIAKALDVRVVGLLEAEPNVMPHIQPLTAMGRAVPGAESATTPIEAGNLEIHATVTVKLEVQ